MAYTKTGPFTNGAAPGISSTFLNNVENYLNAGNTKAGVPLMSWFGPISVTTSGVTTNHNLKDTTGANIVPDVILLTFPDTHTSLHVCSYEHTTLTSTQVTLYADTTINVSGVALKF